LTKPKLKNLWSVQGVNRLQMSRMALSKDVKGIYANNVGIDLRLSNGENPLPLKG